MASHRSEIVLVLVLLILVGFTRVYVGGSEGMMIVWKGEFTYADTLVDLYEIEKMSDQEMAKTHPNVLYQLEEMGLRGTSDDIKPNRRTKRGVNLSSQRKG